MSSEAFNVNAPMQRRELVLMLKDWMAVDEKVREELVRKGIVVWQRQKLCYQSHRGEMLYDWYFMNRLSNSVKEIWKVVAFFKNVSSSSSKLESFSDWR